MKKVKGLFYLTIGSIRVKCSVWQLNFCQYFWSKFQALCLKLQAIPF